MRKQKYVILSVLTLLCVGGSASAIYYVQSQKQSIQKNGISNSSLADASEATDSATTNASSGSLNVATPASTGAMGQLGQNQNNGQSGTSTSQSGVPSSNESTASGSGSATTSANESAIEKMLDPTTFSQYDAPKYLDATSTYYADLQVGTGPTIAAGQTVSVYYKGWLTNGQLFDETKDNSSGQMQPFQFTYGANPSQVITGWEDGLAGMKVGGVRFLIIPPSEGYGAAGQGAIPGNSVLIFQVQLVAAQ